MYFFLKHCKASPCLRGRTRQWLACSSLISGINGRRGYSWEFHPSFSLGSDNDCRVLSKCNKCKFGPQIFIAGYITHDKKDSLVSDPRLILQRQYLQEKVIYWTKSFPFFSFVLHCTKLPSKPRDNLLLLVRKDSKGWHICNP